MFTKIKKDMRESVLQLFAFIVTATQGSAGFGLAPDVLVQKMVKAEPTFLEVNKTVAIDKDGNVQVRATDAGIAAYNAQQAAIAAGTVVEAASTEAVAYEVFNDLPLPTLKRGGLKGETYPFDKLLPGQAFFVPATETKPNPAKSLASTVSSATKRYAATKKQMVNGVETNVPTGKDGRKFTIRAVTAENSPNKKAGALVYRLKEAPAAPAAPSA